MEVTFTALIEEGMRQMTELLAPFGFESGANVSEAMAAIPEDWVERENLYRLIFTISDLEEAVEILRLVGHPPDDGWEQGALQRLGQPL